MWREEGEVGTKSHHQLGSYRHLIAAVRIRVVDDPVPVRLNTLQGSPYYQEMLGQHKMDSMGK